VGKVKKKEKRRGGSPPKGRHNLPTKHQKGKCSAGTTGPASHSEQVFREKKKEGRRGPSPCAKREPAGGVESDESKKRKFLSPPRVLENRFRGRKGAQQMGWEGRTYGVQCVGGSFSLAATFSEHTHLN